VAWFSSKGWCVTGGVIASILAASNFSQPEVANPTMPPDVAAKALAFLDDHQVQASFPETLLREVEAEVQQPGFDLSAKTAARAEYSARINRVLDHIEANLDRPLRLEELARVACFSPFHFHRVFSAMMGEPLGQFIGRLRVERAAVKLISSPHLPVTDIALDCGFSSSAAFARAFKEAFSMSASQWRDGGYARSKIGKAHGKPGQSSSNPRQAWKTDAFYLDDVTRNQVWRMTMKSDSKPDNPLADFTVEVREMAPRSVAYVRHVGPYAGDEQLFQGLFEKLMTWAGPRDLLRSPDMEVLCVYHDDPGITDEAKLRTSACLTVPEGTEVSGEVGAMSVAGGKYAVGKFELTSDQSPQAWDALMGGWLPESGYQPDDRPCFELYLQSPEQHPEGKCVTEICVPVKPL